MPFIERLSPLTIALFCAATIVTLSASAQSRNRAGAHRKSGARLLSDRFQWPHRLPCRLQGKDRGARMDQPRMPVCPQTLWRQQHAGAAEEMDRARRGVAVGDLIRARPGRACVAAASEQADGRSRRGAERGVVRSDRQGRARLRRAHHAAYVCGQRRRRARLCGRHRRPALGAARGSEDREKFRRQRADRDCAGQAGVRQRARAPMGVR